MAEKEQDALPAVEQEAAGRPVPQVSGGSPEAGSATTGPDVSALEKKIADLEQTIAKIPDQIDARFKSDKDKRYAKVEEIHRWVQAAGGDVAKIEDKLERQALQDRLDNIEKGVSGSAGVQGRTSEQDPESATAEFLNSLKDKSGIEISDEELKQVWSGKRYTTYQDAFKDVEKYAWRKAKQANIGAGAAASSGGGKPPEPETDEEILAGMEEAMKQPTKKAEELKRLRETAKRRGLLK